MLFLLSAPHPEHEITEVAGMMGASVSYKNEGRAGSEAARICSSRCLMCRGGNCHVSGLTDWITSSALPDTDHFHTLFVT